MSLPSHHDLLTENEHLRQQVAVLQAQLEAVRTETYLEALHETAATLNNQFALDDLLAVVLIHAARLADAEHGFVYLQENDEPEVIAKVAMGVFRPLVGQVVYSTVEGSEAGGGAVGLVWQSGETVVLDDYDRWPKSAVSLHHLFRALVVVPLKLHDRVVGVLGLAHSEPARRFDPQIVRLLQGFGRLSSIALLNATLYNQLEKSQKFVQKIADTIPDVLYVNNTRLARNIFVNPKVNDLLGLTPQQYQGMTAIEVAQLVHPDDFPRLLAFVETKGQRDSDTIAEVEYRMRHQDGTWRWVRNREVVFTRAADGLPLETLGTLEDVTERKRMEDALRASEERFRQMADSAPAYIWVSDENGQTTYVSRLWLEFTGTSHEYELGVGWQAHIHPDDRQHVAQVMAETYARRAVLNVEYRARRHDGVYRWLIDKGIPRFDAEGNYLGYIGSSIDMTERKQMEDALRTSEERFRTLMELLDVMVAIYQSSGLVYLNPAVEAVTGYPVDDLLGEGFWKVMHPDTLSSVRFEADYFELNQDVAQARREFPIIVKSGETRWITASATMVEIDATPSVLVTAMDITDRKQAEQHELRLKVESERIRILAEFAHAASHDFRTPLATISTSLYLLERTADADRRSQRIRIIEQQVGHLAKLVDSMLLMIILDADNHPNFRPLDLCALLQELYNEWHQRAVEKQQTFTLSLPPSLPFIQGDEGRLRRAVANLIENACVYTPENGQIHLHAQQQDEHVLVVVEDNGQGIRAEDLPRIFDQFYRGDKARPVGGVGLGLSIARRIVEQHGGTLTAWSEPEQGSSFYLLLPYI